MGFFFRFVAFSYLFVVLRLDVLRLVVLRIVVLRLDAKGLDALRLVVLSFSLRLFLNDLLDLRRSVRHHDLDGVSNCSRTVGSLIGDRRRIARETWFREERDSSGDSAHQPVPFAIDDEDTRWSAGIWIDDLHAGRVDIERQVICEHVGGDDAARRIVGCHIRCEGGVRRNERYVGDVIWLAIALNVDVRRIGWIV